MSAATQDFKVKFDGQLHQVDANTLINSLINISTIVQEVNEELQTNEKIEIKIKALSPGSFDVNLCLKAIGQHAQNIIPSQVLEDGANIISILSGLLNLKKHLGAKAPKDVKEVHGGKIEITNDKGNVLVVESLTFNIYEQNQAVQDSISNNFETLQNDTSVEGFELIDAEEHIIFDARKEEFSEMSIKSVVVEENKRTVTETATLHIFKLVFQDNYKWEFYYKGNKISANIVDSAFFQRIDEGETFAKGDTIVVELQINQIFDKAVNTFVNHSYQINRVIKHTPRNQQQTINFDRDEDSVN